MSEKKNTRLNNWIKKRKKIIIGLLTVALIIFMITIVDFPKFIQKLSIIGLWGIFLFFILYSIAFLLRAYKLKLIFKGLDEDINFFTVFFSIGTGFLINELTPGKIGELAKIGFIRDEANIAISNTICGVTIERFLDLIFLFVISVFALIYLYVSTIGKNEVRNFLGYSIRIYLLIGAAFVVLVILGLFLLIYKTKMILTILNKVSTKLSNLTSRFILNFKEGMKRFKGHKKIFTYVLLIGIPTWLVDASIIVLFFYLLGFELDIMLLILAVILLFFSKSIPITPGGWGISENIGALFIYFFYPEIAFVEILSIFIIDHLFRSVYIYLYGGYSIFHYNINLRKVSEDIL